MNRKLTPEERLGLAALRGLEVIADAFGGARAKQTRSNAIRKETHRARLNRWRTQYAAMTPDEQQRWRLAGDAPPDSERDHATFISCQHLNEGGWGPVKALLLVCKSCSQERLARVDGYSNNSHSGTYPSISTNVEFLRQSCPRGADSCTLDGYDGD
jgi:hypothetical protein